MVQIADKAPILRKQHWMGVDRSLSRTPRTLRYRGNYVGLRYDGGMLVYGSCSSSELLMFAINRKLSPPANASEQLVTLLEENEKFPRFVDLPAELRRFIYEHYFDFNPHKYTSVRVPPPVTEANKILRTEALPQFWAEQRLRIRVLTWSLLGQPFFVFDINSSRFFRRAAEEHIGMVKKLHVELQGGNWEWELDLSRGEKPPAVRRVQGFQHQFDEPLLEFLKSIGKRPESDSFSKGDAWKLESLLRELTNKARLG